MVCPSILFCFAILSFGLFSKSRTGQGSKNGEGGGGGLGLGQLIQKVDYYANRYSFDSF